MTFLELQNFTAGLVNDKLFGFHTQADIKLFLNNALLKVQRRLLKCHAAYYTKCVYTTTVIDQVPYSLPDNFLCLYDLELILSGTAPNQEKLQLEFMSLNQRHDFKMGNGTPTHFYFLQNSINIMVPPSQAWEMHLYFAEKAPAMVDDSDEPDCPSQFHELIGLLAARQCFTVDDRVSTLVDDDIKKFNEEIAATEERQLSKPRYVLEVE